ncbi:hypothetical protein FOCC_FOCC001539 [Frankliniella occidentalis]|nr:hypothetical protein FOCC_FOCC001539 [Frankliniella occidentalis]
MVSLVRKFSGKFRERTEIFRKIKIENFSDCGSFVNFPELFVEKKNAFPTLVCVAACRLVGGGVHALFGPTDPLLGTHVHSVCDALDIPHLEVRLDPDTHYREFSINLHPSQDMLNRAFIDLMGFLNWTKVAVIYEEDSGLMRLRDLVREDTELYVRQADPAYYRAVLKDIKAKEIYNLIVDTRADTMRFFLREVLQLQMNDYKYHFVFTTFDMESFDLEDFKYNFVNITSFRIVDAEDMSVREVLKDMEVNLNKSKGIQVRAQQQTEQKHSV